MSTASPRPEVSPALGSGLEERWPRIGKFDVSLRWAGTITVFGELKCGADEAALDACVWDAAKSAMVVRCGKAVGAHLVAAAPSALWSRRGLGVELLLGGDWNTAALRDPYAAGWRRWERDGYKPVRLPDRIRTEAVSDTEFAIAGRPWRLGVARVEPVGEGWLDWKPFLP